MRPFPTPALTASKPPSRPCSSSTRPPARCWKKCARQPRALHRRPAHAPRWLASIMAWRTSSATCTATSIWKTTCSSRWPSLLKRKLSSHSNLSGRTPVEFDRQEKKAPQKVIITCSEGLRSGDRSFRATLCHGYPQNPRRGDERQTLRHERVHQI